MALQDEISQKSAEVKSDNYSMSIGELSNLYKDKEMDIHPEFQRFYRWSDTQKTKLIESILLGIPIPPIFVSQRGDGIWDVVDGLQRLSTIFQFMGILIDENNEKVAPLVLQGTKYLPSLDGKVWEDSSDPDNSFDNSQRLFVKRAKIDVNIILKESSESSKYELFQRLNTGGSPLSSQEIRNCILVLENRSMFLWLKELSQDENFVNTTSLTDKALLEKYDMELVLRFIVFRKADVTKVGGVGDLSEFLTDKMVDIARDKNFDFEMEASAFRSTFKTLNDKVGSDCFRKYDLNKKKFLGGFLVSAFEIVALGLGYNYDSFISKNIDIDLSEKVKQVWGEQLFINSSGSGSKVSTRLPKIVPLGRQIFSI
jgi:hypothetical protein